MDDEDIKNEVAAIVKEIEYAVTSVKISSVDTFCLTTKEGALFSLRLINAGLEVVTVEEYHPLSNKNKVIVGQIFETIYSFLTVVSSSYQSTFASAVSQKLSSLAS